MTPTQYFMMPQQYQENIPKVYSSIQNNQHSQVIVNNINKGRKFVFKNCVYLSVDQLHCIDKEEYRNAQ